MIVNRRACLLVGMPFVFSCGRNGDTVRIDLFVTSKAPLREVYLLIGAEKYMWPQLAPDERGTLQARLMEPQPMVVRYRLWEGQRLEWKSEPIDPYKIRVVQADLSGSADSPVSLKMIAR
jgi:hypothetical protein